MPGYGIREAATTLTAQTVGSGQAARAREVGGVTIAVGMAVMTLMGVVMFVAAEPIIATMTPDSEIVKLGATVLRLCRTDVCRLHCRLRLFPRVGRHPGPECHEPGEHVDCATTASLLVGPIHGAGRRLDCHVFGTLFPRGDFPRAFLQGILASGPFKIRMIALFGLKTHQP